MSKYLLIGGNGFIGKSICKILLKRNDEVFIYDNFSNSSFHQAKKLLNNQNIFEGDIRDKGNVLSVIKEVNPDFIIHLAAIHYIPDCDKDPELMHSINIKGTINILESIVETKSDALFLFPSTASVYKSEYTLLTEDTPPSPQNIYGDSKLLAEGIIKERLKERFVIFRLFNVYGTEDQTPHIIPSFISQAVKSNHIKVGNLTPIRDYILVDDVAKAFTQDFPKQSLGNIFNLGTGNGYSPKDILDLLSSIKQKVLSNDIELTYEQSSNLTRSNDNNSLVACMSKFKAAFGWAPNTEFKEALEEVFKSQLN
jgi:UDP-glucose 4-epimerase